MMEAYYIDDGVLLAGKIYKNELMPIGKFIPDDKGCGFSSQYIYEEDLGRDFFYSKQKAMEAME